MEPNNPVITLCIEGIWAEMEDRPEDALRSYKRAWDSRSNEYEACIVAHYLARVQDSTEAALEWDLRALELAFAVPQEQVRDFYPALYMSVANSYKNLGGNVQAQRYYRLAAGLGEIQPLETENEVLRWLKSFDWIQPLLQGSLGD